MPKKAFIKRFRYTSFTRRAYRALMPFLLLAACVLADIGASAAPWPGGGGDVVCPSYDPAASPFVLPDLGPFETKPAGTVPGVFTVSTTGEAIYSMPLTVPPGRADMQPSPTLTYNSAGGDGILGMGFSLTGFSVVTHCPKNLAQDGEIKGVLYEDFDKSDAFCLDGKRLVPVPPSVPGPATVIEYRTFPDTFARVRAHTADPSDHQEWIKGPQFFEVQTKSGLTLELGSAPGGGVPSARELAKDGIYKAWWVSRIVDRYGNTINFTYQKTDASDGHTIAHRPYRIDYTGHTQGGAMDKAPTRQVRFDYESKDLATFRRSFDAGLYDESTLRISKVNMLLEPGDIPVREYRLSYDLNPATQRTRLVGIRECAADTVCKPPTIFTYNSSGLPGFSASKTDIPRPNAKQASVMPMDVNGDGLDDLVIPDFEFVDADGEGYASNPVAQWSVRRALGSKSGALIFETAPVNVTDEVLNAPSSGPAIQETGTSIDYNQDGLADILLHDRSRRFLNWKVLIAQPDQGFQKLDTGLYHKEGIGSSTILDKEASSHLADVNGDGVPDLIQCATGGLGNAWTLNLWTSVGPGFEATSTPIDVLIDYPCDSEVHTVDVDADGKVDLVMLDGWGNSDGFTYTDNYLKYSYVTPGQWSYRSLQLFKPPPSATDRLLFADINGDGLPDAIATGVGDGHLRTFFNTGEGFAPGNFALSSSIQDFIFLQDEAFVRLAQPIDFNADGREDLLIPMVFPVDSLIPSWVVLQATGELGEGAFEIVPTSIPFDAKLLDNGKITLADPLTPRVIDAGGDGTHDVLIPLDGVFWIFKNNLGAEEDRLATVTDGLNALNGIPGSPAFVPNLTITYDHLVDHAILNHIGELTAAAEPETYLAHNNPGNDCAYPIRCVVGPRRIVNSYSRNNGADIPRTFEIAYRDGRFHRLGRGFLGFGSRVVREREAGTGSVEYFDNITFDEARNEFPFAGQVVSEHNWSSDLLDEDHPGMIELSYKTTEYNLVQTNGGSTYFTLPVTSSSTRKQGYYQASGSQTIEQFASFCQGACGATELGTSRHTIKSYDTLFGNIRGEVTSTDGLDLTTNVKRSFTNNIADWLIGQLDEQTECSEAAGIKHCRTTKRTYNSNGKIETASVASDDGDPGTQIAYTFAYDPILGNLIKTTADDAFFEHRSTCTSYEPQGIFPFAHRNAAGHLSRSKYHPGLGVMLQAIDADNLVTRIGYDGFGRTMQENLPDGTITVNTINRSFDATNGFVVTAEANTLGGADDTVRYDSLGRVVQWWTRGVDLGVPAPRITGTIAFDRRGEHVAKKSIPAAENAPAGTQLYDTYEYDSVGRILKHTGPWNNAETTYSYDGATTFAYDWKGSLKSTVEHDALGRASTITDAEKGPTLYEYGPFSDLLSVTSPGGLITHIDRDGLGRLQTLTDPDRGATVITYNGFGDRLTVTTDKWVSIFAHDLLGRTTSRFDDDGATTAASIWTWDPLHGTGQVSSVVTSSNEKSFTYDQQGRLKTSTLLIGGEPFQTTFDYDPWFGRLNKVTYPQGSGAVPFAVEHEYDPWGHLTAVRRAGGGTAYWKLTGTDAVGRPKDELFGNGVTTTRNYFDSRNRLASILTTGPVTSPPSAHGTLQSLSYTYDERLNVTSRTDKLQGTSGRTETFEYDALDRLTCAYFDDVNACPQANAYDADGNIVSRPKMSYAYDDLLHPHGATGDGSSKYEYDVVGNQIKRPGADLITYAAFGLPNSITLAAGAGTVDFDYSGDQERVRKHTSSATTIYAGGLYEQVRPAGSAPVEHHYYVHSSERVVAEVIEKGATESTLYMHVDHLGSVDVVTNESGVEQERRSYDAFGERRDPVWQGPVQVFSSLTTQGFTWQEQDEEVGLVNMKGRMYDPHLGRFLTPDPLVVNPAFSQSWNPYSYVLNNPLKYIDPSGFANETPALLPSQSTEKPVSVTTAHRAITAVAVLSRPQQGPAPKGPDETGAAPQPTDLRTTGTAAVSTGGIADRGPTSRTRSTDAAIEDTGWQGIAQGESEYFTGVGSGFKDAALAVPEISPKTFLPAAGQLALHVWERGAVGAVKDIIGDPLAEKWDDFNAAAAAGDDEGAGRAVGEAIPAIITTGLTLGAVIDAGKDALDATKSAGSAGGDRAGKQFTPNGKQEVLDRSLQPDGTIRCANCGTATVPAEKSMRGVTPRPDERQIDHIFPKSRGGDGSPGNGQVLCRQCNRKLGDKKGP